MIIVLKRPDDYYRDLSFLLNDGFPSNVPPRYVPKLPRYGIPAKCEDVYQPCIILKIICLSNCIIIVLVISLCHEIRINASAQSNMN